MRTKSSKSYSNATAALIIVEEKHSLPAGSLTPEKVFSSGWSLPPIQPHRPKLPISQTKANLSFGFLLDRDRGKRAFMDDELSSLGRTPFIYKLFPSTTQVLFSYGEPTRLRQNVKPRRFYSACATPEHRIWRHRLHRSLQYLFSWTEKWARNYANTPNVSRTAELILNAQLASCTAFC